MMDDFNELDYLKKELRDVKEKYMEIWKRTLCW